MLLSPSLAPPPSSLPLPFPLQSEIAVRERVARFNADPSRLVNIVLRMAEAPVDPFGPAYQAIANGEYLADNGQAAAVIDASCTFVVGLVSSAVQPQCFFFFF